MGLVTHVLPAGVPTNSSSALDTLVVSRLLPLPEGLGVLTLEVPEAPASLLRWFAPPEEAVQREQAPQGVVF